jgi:hypothetical protein
VIHRAVVTNVTFRQALVEAQCAGKVYGTELFGSEVRTGKIVAGPGLDNVTTVGLLEDDDGKWLAELAVKNGGTFKEDVVFTDAEREAMETAVWTMCSKRGDELEAAAKAYPRLWSFIRPLRGGIDFDGPSVSTACQNMIGTLECGRPATAVVEGMGRKYNVCEDCARKVRE